MSSLFCIWCEKELIDDATRDHLIPRCIVTKSVQNNIAPACYNCNSERGKLPSFYGNFLQLKRRIRRKIAQGREIHGKLQRIIDRYNKKANDIKKLLQYWEQIERKQIGWTPSTSIPFVWAIDDNLINSMKRDYENNVKAVKETV